MTTRRTGATRRGVLLTLAAGAGLAACGPSADGARPFRIGFQKNGPMLIAKERGVVDAALKAAGVAAVEWREFQAGPPLLEALGVGGIDLGHSGDSPPIFAQAAGNPFRYVAAIPLSGAAGGVLTPAGSPVRTMADMKGRKLAFARGSSGHFQAVVALRSAGLTLDDVEQVNLGPADAAAAFAQGGVDGWVIWDPFYTAAVRDQGARVLIPGEQLGGSSAFVLASPDVTAERPDALRAALSAIAEAGAWADANRAEAGGLIAKATGLKPDLVADIAQREAFTVTALTPAILARQQTIADTFASLGVIPAPVKTADAAWTGWSGPA